MAPLIRRWLSATVVIGSVAACGLLSGPTPASAKTVREYEWHINALQIPQAQQVSRGDGVVVAVIDGGVDTTRPTLAGQVLPGAEFGVPESPNGQVDTDSEGHGTAMSGIIAAKGGGPMDMLGIAPGAKILPIAVRDDQGTASALRWAADHGAKVANVSIGDRGQPNPQFVDAVRYALQKNVVVVVAAGNVAQTGVAVTGSGQVPGVVTVSGSDRGANFWTGSAHGPQVVVAAPAVGIISTVPTRVDPQGYLLGDGTSSATAIVSGVVALVRAKYPNLDAANVINRVIRTAKDQGDPGRDQYFGFGTVKPILALQTNVAPVSANPLGMPAGPSLESAPDSTQSAVGGNGGSSDTNSPLVIALVAGLAGVGLLALIVIVIMVRARARRSASLSGAAMGQPQYQSPSTAWSGTQVDPTTGRQSSPPAQSTQPSGQPAAAIRWPQQSSENDK
jgi:type VII secretion-associated serine protease mycosin